MLNLYIEKAFLDDFYIAYDEDSASDAQKTVYQILVNYPEKRWFLDIDINLMEEFKNLKLENPLIGEMSITIHPNYIPSFDLKNFSTEPFLSTIIFTQKDKDWFTEAENKGVICLSIENYEEKVTRIKKEFHFKIDLSESFDWSKLRLFSILNWTVLNDNYILSDKDKQKIDKNLVPLLKRLIQDYQKEVKIDICTQDFNPPQAASQEMIFECARKRKQKLNRVFANYQVKFQIFNEMREWRELRMHDRVLMTNFQVVDCGEGFNLMPFTPSNSQIISETIFDIYTYKRLKNLIKSHKKYSQTLFKKKENTSKFTYI